MQNEFSAEQQQQLLAKLTIPFHPDAISWRVTNKSKDGKRGCVIPYSDQRAYTDRLNEVFTPAGWTRVYDVTTLSSVTRTKKNVAIQTGKVIVTCVVTIHGLGSHSGSGEMWADDDNAMTRAEAQAFKRACSFFGLGRYFYDFAEMWVDLDDYGNPLRISDSSQVGASSRCGPDEGRAGACRLRGAVAAEHSEDNGERQASRLWIGGGSDATNRELSSSSGRRSLLRGISSWWTCSQSA